MRLEPGFAPMNYGLSPTPFDDDGWFDSGGPDDAHADAGVESTPVPERVDNAVAKERERRARGLLRLVGRILIVPSAIVGFVGASDIDRASAAYHAAARPTLRSESPAAPTAAAVAAAPAAAPNGPREEPAATAPWPVIGVENAPVDRMASVKVAKKKRRRAAPAAASTVAPASDPAPSSDSIPPASASDDPLGALPTLID